MNDHPSNKINPGSTDEGVRSLRKGVRLEWAQLSHLTLGQAELILKESAYDVHEGFLQLFATLAGIAGAETARAFALIGVELRSGAAGEGRVPDWSPFFAALKRERTARAITEEMTLRTLSELLWEMHTAQAAPAPPRPATSERSRPETEA